MRWKRTPISLIALLGTLVSCGGGLPPASSSALPIASAFSDSASINAAPLNSLEAPKVSPDGRQLAITGYQDGVHRLALVRHGAITVISPPNMFVDDYAWMPDSKHLAIASNGLPPAAGDTQAPDALTIVDTGGRQVRHIVPAAAFLNRQTDGMSVAPSGNTVAITADALASGDHPNRLAFVSLPTGHTTFWTPVNGLFIQSPSYISDDQVVLAQADLSGSTSQVVRLEVGGGTVAPISPTAEYAYAPSARYSTQYVVFAIGRLSVQALATAWEDGSHYRVIRNDGTFNFPVETGDSQYLIATNVGSDVPQLLPLNQTG